MRLGDLRREVNGFSFFTDEVEVWVTGERIGTYKLEDRFEVEWHPTGVPRLVIRVIDPREEAMNGVECGETEPGPGATRQATMPH